MKLTIDSADIKKQQILLLHDPKTSRRAERRWTSSQRGKVLDYTEAQDDTGDRSSAVSLNRTNTSATWFQDENSSEQSGNWHAITTSGEEQGGKGSNREIKV